MTTITRAEALSILGDGTQTPGLAMGRLINELFDRIEALEATTTGFATGVGITLPTEDPLLDGTLWADTGIVTVSAGTP